MITICYISRNRPQYLSNSIKTMALQNVLPEKIVIIDCSDDFCQVKKVIENFNKNYDIPCELHWKPAIELSRSAGRQMGRKYVKTPIMVSCEGDCLYPPGIIEKTIKAFGEPLKKIYAQSYYAAYQKNGTLGSIFKNHRNGSYQAFRVNDFDDIGGYNPFLTNWGFEDADIKERLINYGCKEIIIPLIIRHQYHDSSSCQETNLMNQKIARNSYFDTKTKTWKLKDGFKL